MSPKFFFFYLGRIDSRYQTAVPTEDIDKATAEVTGSRSTAEVTGSFNEELLFLVFFSFIYLFVYIICF